MIRKAKLYLKLILLNLLSVLPFDFTSVSPLRLIDIRQQMSVAAFVEAAESLKKVMSLYRQSSEQYSETAENLRERAKQMEKNAEQSDKMSAVANAKVIKTREELVQLQKLID